MSALQGYVEGMIELNGSGGGSSVSYESALEEGTTIGTLTIDGEDQEVIAPSPTSVSVTQVQSTGTKIATVSVDGTNTDLYAPSPTSVSVTQVQSTGTKIATVSVDGTSTDLYAPTGSSGSTVSYTQTYSGGTTIGTITIDGTSTDIKSPSATIFNTSYPNGTSIGSLTGGAGTYPIYLPYNEYTGQLLVGSTSVTISNAKIHSYSTVDIYTSVFGLYPTNVVVSEGSVVLTFDAQESVVNVKVRCY